MVHEGTPDREETLKWGFPHFARKGILCSSFRVRSNSTYWRACIAAQLDRPAEAVSLLAQALDQAIWHGHHPHTDPCLDPLRDHPPFREVMRPKG